MMRLIVSAHRAEANPWYNAQQTAALLREIQNMNLLGELVAGRYEGGHEISVSVSAFRSEEQLGGCAEYWLRRFDQQCVMAVLDNKAYSISRDGTEYMGEVRYTVALPDQPSVNYTLFMDGRILTVEPA